MRGTSSRSWTRFDRMSSPLATTRSTTRTGSLRNAGGGVSPEPVSCACRRSRGTSTAPARSSVASRTGSHSRRTSSGSRAGTSPGRARRREGEGTKRIGIADTTFARYDMAAAAVDELKRQGGGFTIVRYTVPGIKDLPAACKILFDQERCDIVIALGMVGRQPVDKDCALVADYGLQMAQVQAGKHVLGGMVHEDEAKDDPELAILFDRRTRQHAIKRYDRPVRT